MTAAPNMHNFTDDHLADEIGALSEEAKEINARLNAFKDEAKRRGIESAQGSHWRISVTTGERKTLDVEGVRQMYDVRSFERTTPTCTLRISALFQQPEVVG